MTRYSSFTELDLINEAWQVQNACNLSGVVHSFSDALTRLREIFENRKQWNSDFRYSTTDINQHIVSKLFSSKIASLAGELPLDLSGYGINF
jgi:hypothetical protein